MRINLFLDPELKTDLDKILGKNSLIGNGLVYFIYIVAKSITEINSKV